MTPDQFHASRRSIATPSGRIAYVERGEGLTALFVHGVPLNGYHWRSQLEGLSDIRRCLAPDLMGLGASEIDVGQADSATRMADEIGRRHGGVDIVFGNAVMRVGPDDDERAVVGPYVEVNNLGTTRLLRAFAPILRDGGRLVVVASSLGTLAYLAPVLHPWFDGLTTLDEVDRAIVAWRDEVAAGRTRATAWPAFVNIPSKIGQVAAVRALAGERRPEDTRRDIMLLSVCPGMINTPTSGLWWDVSAAPTPAEAAGPLLDLVLGPFRPEFYGELVRAGEVLAWSR